MRLELQHRLRNCMASVRAIAQRTHASSQSLDEFFEAFDARLRALGLSQALIAKSGDAGGDLIDVVSDQLQLLGGNLQTQINIEGPDIVLEEKAAEILALAVHELAINAIRYGALSDDAGEISVRWRVDGDDLVFEWRERCATTVEPVDDCGFGRELLEQGLDYTLGGRSTFEFTPEGVHFRSVIPLSRNIKEVGGK